MKRALKYGLGVGAGALLLEAVLALPAGAWAEQPVEWLHRAGAAGVALYAVAYVTVTLLVLPASLITAGAGLAYGPILGTMLVSPVSVTAATLAFLVGRTFARDWVARRMERDVRFAAIDAAIGRHGLQIVLLLRLSPIVPFSVLNYALGLTRVRLRDFVLGSFVGMLPGTFLYVYLGSLVTTVSALGGNRVSRGFAQNSLYWAGLAATVVATIVITRIARRALNDAIRREGEPGSSTAPSTIGTHPRCRRPGAAPVAVPPH
ncbi:MAG: TVP38/TMEM64 family protein [Acidobacteria bacterium]|nr:TVP38/TMEM64 family protein [Acidobacteriota bacterium]